MARGIKIKLVLALLLLAGVVLFWRGQEMRAENQVLSARIAEAQKFSAGSQPVLELRAVEAQIEELNNTNKDIFKLRNEITQLRRQKQDAEKLRIENHELEEKIQGGKASTGDASLPPDYLHRSEMVDAGFATPEAALQTFFLSLVMGDYKRFTDCMSQPGEIKRLGLDSEGALQFRKDVSKWEQFPGYYIIETKFLSPDQVSIQAKTSRGGPSVPFTLARRNNEWKIEKLPAF